MPAALTLETLQKLANKPSFERGRNYYRHGAVGKIKLVDWTFSARVQGGESYRASFDLSGSKPKPRCSCPYDFDGICKHLVALGLAIIDQKELLLPAAPDVEALWKALPDKRKLDFLLTTLRAQPVLALQFQQFATAPSAPPAPARPARRPHDPQQIAEALTALEFDEETLEAGFEDDDYGDVDEWYEEDLAEYFDGLIDDQLLTATEELDRFSRLDKPLDALRYWADVGAALLVLPDPEVDDYDLYANFGSIVRDRWHEQYLTFGWPDRLASQPFPKNADRKALQVFLEQHLHPKKRVSPAATEAHWVAVLLTLAANPEAAKIVRATLPDATAVLPATRDRLLLRIAQTLADDVEWVKYAEKLFLTDAGIARQLFQFYRNQASAANVVRIAPKLLAHWPHQFAADVLEAVPSTTAAGRKVRLEVLKIRLRTQLQWADFTEFAELAPAAEVTAFVAEMARSGYPSETQLVLVAQMFHHLGRGTELAEYLEKLDLLTYPRIPEVLALLLPLQPAATVDLVVAYIERGLQEKLRTQRRGHAMYQQFAAWLAFLHRQAPLREQVRTVVDFLMEQYRHLALLRKYLREAKLVSSLPAHIPLDELAEDEVQALLTAKQKPGRKPRVR